MKKAIPLLLSVLMLVGLLSGCVQNDLGITLNGDGSGSVAMTLGIEQDFYNQLKSGGSDPFEGKTTTTYEDGDDTYVAYTETKQYNTYEDIEKALLDMEYRYDLLDSADSDEEHNNTDTETVVDEVAIEPAETETPTDMHIFKTVEIEKTGNAIHSVYSFKAVMNPQSQTDETSYDLNDIFKITLSVEMPSDITESSGGKVEGNKVVFDIEKITEANEFSATSETNNTGLVIGIIAVVVIIGALVAFLFRRHK